MSEKLATFLSYPSRNPPYTEAQRELWNLMTDLVRQFPPEDVLDAVSDAFLMESNETSGDKSKRLLSIGRALEKVCAEQVGEVV